VASRVPLVRLEAISKSYADRPVLDGVQLELHRGELTSLTGASGSGKSTLISLLAGLLSPDGGRIVFDGEDLGSMSDEQRASVRARRIGVVLQSENLVPFLTADENVELARTFSSGGPGRAELLQELGVDDRRDHLPRRMSGGQAQRVAIAVALANEPDLVLADEITGQLDTSTADEVMGAIVDAQRRHGMTVLFVTHDHGLADRADRRLVIESGQVHER
jgi:ABC-type lipoprotein export system ATPase subunit